MISHEQAVAAKPRVRGLLRSLGAVIVTIGVEDTLEGARITVGLASDVPDLPTFFVVEQVPVKVQREAFGAVV